MPTHEIERERKEWARAYAENHASLLLGAVVARRRLVTRKGCMLLHELIEVASSDNRGVAAGSDTRPRIIAGAHDGAVDTPLSLWPLLSPPYLSLRCSC
jgi:hypothetical protein